MSSEPATGELVRIDEVRILQGPNLYFTRPAVKISLRLPGYLDADEATIRAVAAALRVRGVVPGEAGTAARQRATLRLVERALRGLAREAGATRLGVRTRPGSDPAEVVVAFPWRSRERGQALGEAVGPMLEGLLQGEVPEQLYTSLAAPLRELPSELPPRLRPATVPTIAITGTNGKTTTTRLVAHIGMTAGLRTGWSSTDGVLVQGELVETGDYSGPAGARAVLDAPGVELGVLETARGGMLLKGLGLPSYDVSVVTNVSSDHLGEHGIDTLDQLAEVKAIITRVTKPTGWTVLNGDDPRVWAMRTVASGQPWCFSLDPDSPALRESLQLGGRGITVLDGEIVVLKPGHDPEHLLPLVDVPMTLAGLARHNVANALAGAAGALGLGLSAADVAEGLRTFAADGEHNPGRLNVYSMPVEGGSCTVVLDMAHNEDGLDALLTVADGLRAPGGRLLLGLGTGGDRQDDVLRNLGEMAGLRADLVRIQHKQKYLRGRDPNDMTVLFQEGLARAGMAATDAHDTELEGLQALLGDAQDGDVIAFMVHQYWALLQNYVLEHGGSTDDAARIKAKVVAGARHSAAQRQPAGVVPRAVAMEALEAVRHGRVDVAERVLRAALDG